MDQLLESRYRTLFNIYGAGANNVVINIKGMLAEFMTKDPGLLRSDAVYFLLVNFDEMIFRPHASYIPTPDAKHGLPMQPFSDEKEVNLLPRINEALTIILKALDPNDRPASAHSVMKAIDKNWDILQKLFGWG